VNEKEITENLGGRIRQLRKDLGLTQAELAERMDIDESALRRLEISKITNPRLSTLIKLCEALYVSLEDLVTPGGESTT
jgi:transcriptional regulator with XRE-family HTH domain